MKFIQLNTLKNSLGGIIILTKAIFL